MLSRRSTRRTRKWQAYMVIIFVLAFFVIADSGPLAENAQPRVLRSRAYRLTIALSKDVKHQLESLGIGTKIDVLSQDILIVTSPHAADLIAASSLIDLIDSKESYVVKVLADYSESDTLPTTEQIADSIGLSGVGSFSQPPAAGTADRIIVDVRGSKVIAVVPVSLLDRVSAAVSKLMVALKADAAQLAEDTEQSKSPPAAESGVEAETGAQPQAPSVADVKPEATIDDMIDELLVTDYPAKETPQVADIEPETTTADVAGEAVAEEDIAETTVADKPESHDFFQAEMFASLAEGEADAKSVLDENAEAERKVNEALARAIKAEKVAAEKERLAAEAKAKADLAEIAEAKRQADEALARANKAEEVAKEKERLAAEALRRATEAEKKAATAQEAAAPDQPVKKETPAKTDAAAQKTKTLPKTAAAGKEQPKAAAKAEDKTQPVVAPKASTEPNSPVPPPSADDKMLEMLKKLAAQATAKEDEGETTEDKPKTAPVPPIPGTTAKTTPATPPVPKPTTARIPPGAGITDKVATETPLKVDSTIADPEAEVITTMTLPEKVKISSLIELVGKQLKINYMYDTKDVALVNSEVFLKLHDGRIKVKDMYMLLESVLKSKSYAMMRRGNFVIITKSADVLNVDPNIREGVDDGQLGSMIVTTVFKLKHISTATAQAMLKNMKLGLLYNPIEETKTLMVTGYAYRMPRMEEILKMVDVPGKERIFRSRKLEYLLPSELAEKVKALAGELGTISITVSAQATKPTTVRASTPRTSGRTTVRPPTVRSPITTPKALADKGVFLDTDDRTNRVLMIGLEDDLATVDMLIDSLDVAKYGLMSVKEYAMQFVQATEILNALGELGVITAMPRSTTSSRYPTTIRTTPTSRTPARPTTPTRTQPTYGTTRPVQGEPQISVRLATNSLLVNATPEQHAEIEMMIRFVDVEQKDIRTVQEYEIQYVDITEVVETLAELGIVEQRASSRQAGRYTSSRTPTGRTPTTAGAAAPAVATTTFETTTGAEITSKQPQIAVLESTNSLLVYATPKQHDTIALIVAHVDRELPGDTTPYVVYPLENQDPEELAAILSEIVDVTTETAAKSSPTSKVQANATTTAGIPPKREKDDIQIVADPKTYSIIVYADRKNQQWISALIEELDAYRPQVLLDVTLVEISKTDDFMFDVQNALKVAGGNAFDVLSGISVDGTPITSPLLDPFPSSSIAEGVVKGGKAWAFFGDKHVQGLLQAIQTKSYGRILARPTLLVDDNQEGTLDSQQTTYVTRTSTITNPGSISGTSTTSENIIFEAYEAGISLAIKPHISKGDNLRLEITLKQSIFDSDQLGGDKPPDTFTNDVVTVVTIPDNSTIILGGLERIQQGKGGTKVPLLGDIPFIGGLFRSTNNTSSVRKLYIFVKGRIMRPGTDLTSQDLIDISKKSRREFEAKEKEMQEYQDWPGIKPKPMDPLHILEDDEYIQELKNGLHKDEKVNVDMKLDSFGETNGSY